MAAQPWRPSPRSDQAAHGQEGGAGAEKGAEARAAGMNFTPL
jgi:hypothetical protein